MDVQIQNPAGGNVVRLPLDDALDAYNAASNMLGEDRALAARIKKFFVLLSQHDSKPRDPQQALRKNETTNKAADWNSPISAARVGRPLFIRVCRNIDLFQRNSRTMGA